MKDRHMYAHGHGPLFTEMMMTSPRGQGGQFLSIPRLSLLPTTVAMSVPDPHPCCPFLNWSHLQLPLPTLWLWPSTQWDSPGSHCCSHCAVSSGYYFGYSHRLHSTPLPLWASIWKTRFLCPSCWTLNEFLVSSFSGSQIVVQGLEQKQPQHVATC